MKAVLFDLFETLVTHFIPDWTPQPRTIAQRLGVDDGVYKKHWPQLDKDWQAGKIAHYDEALKQVCITAGVKPKEKVIDELTAEYRAMMARCFSTIETEIVEMVESLRRAGLMLGVVSNASDLDVEPWSNCKLAPYFDDVVISHEVGLLKPDNRIYELACERLDVIPADVIFVGDGGSNELCGATEAGMAAYWCTWFLDRWPEGIRPNGFEDDDWRQYASEHEPPYDRLARPMDLVDSILR